ncbi:SGNH/GDSL hydrolase family protein [Mesorhizobium sp. 43Arga]
MSTRETVACLGSSSTAGKGQAFDWIGELARRPGNARFEFRNFGVGGDLAYDALNRVDTVLASRPDRVIVWVGGNDALAMVSPKARRLFRIMKLTSGPSSRLQESLSGIVRRTKSAGARVALCSLAPIGEAPASAQAFQAALNSAIRDLSASIRQIAHGEGADYIPIFEAFQAAIGADPGRAFTEFRLLPMYRDAFRTMVLRMSPNEVGRLNGWKFHSDGIHLNRRGGMIAADLIQSYLDSRELPAPVAGG